MMKKALLIMCSVVAMNAFGFDELTLIAATTEGTVVYKTCIAIPPVSVDQQAICAALYTQYVATLAVLNAPLPLVLSLDPDPYVLSPYDICRYETGHIVFGDQSAIPYCPSI